MIQESWSVLAGLFRLSGRRSRLSYLKASVALFLAYTLISYLLVSTAVSLLTLFLVAGPSVHVLSDVLFELGISRGWEYFDLSVYINALISVRYIALMIAMSLICIASFCVQAQRCRDFGWSCWATFIPLIPIIGWIFAWALFFIPGTKGENKYGSPAVALAPLPQT